MVLQAGVLDAESTLSEALHQGDSTPRRIPLNTQLSIGWAVRKTHAAQHTLLGVFERVGQGCVQEFFRLLWSIV